MQGSIRSTIAGVVSGVASYFASFYALGYTNALVMPSWVPLAAWEAFVVLCLGATLVALAIHLAALRILRARTPLALVAFFGTTLVAMALTGLLGFGAKTLAAWVFGALLASLAHHKLWRNHTFKPTPLRCAA